MHRRSLALSFAVAGLVAAACDVTPATQFTVGVTSQVVVPEDVQSVRITASTGGDRGFCETYPVVDGKARLPQSLALAPDAASDPSLQVTITVMGFSVSDTRVKAEATFDECSVPIVSPSDSATEDPNSGPPPNARILRRSKQPYRLAHDVYVPMPLKYACYGVNCPGDQTCKGGTCVPSAVDVTKLPDYDSALLFGDSSACFDESACLGDAVGPDVVDAAHCIYEVPAGSSLGSAGLNVRAIYQPYRAEVLDEDPVEGFTIPNPSKPRQFQLAPGLCSGGLGPKIKNLVASTTCPAKNVFQPLCTEDARTTVLSPVPSLVYLLVDHDQAMSDYVGAATTDPSAALGKALATALSDPVFLPTDVGVRLVPEAGSECTFPKYGTPEVFDAATNATFETVDAGALALATFLGSATPVATSGLAVNQLLSAGGAYAVTVPQGAFNHKALVVMTNRSLDPSLASSCTPNGAASAVQTAAGAGWTTYLVSLRNAYETPAVTQARIDAAKAFATASGATLIAAEGGASSDPDMAKAAAGSGLAQMVATLGGCFYDKPSNLADPTTATLTLKPAGPFAPVVLPLDAQCSSSASGANGWAIDQDGQHIRVCGAACTSIQTAIEANALTTAQRNQTGPAMPGQVLVELTVP